MRWARDREINVKFPILRHTPDSHLLNSGGEGQTRTWIFCFFFNKYHIKTAATPKKITVTLCKHSERKTRHNAYTSVRKSTHHKGRLLKTLRSYRGVVEHSHTWLL